jgi:hypothetical protein
MKKKSTSQSAFFKLRALFGVVIVLAGVSLALLASGLFSAQAQPKYKLATYYTNSMDPLVPPGFDCSKIHELGIDSVGAVMPRIALQRI